MGELSFLPSPTYRKWHFLGKSYGFDEDPLREACGIGTRFKYFERIGQQLNVLIDTTHGAKLVAYLPRHAAWGLELARVREKAYRLIPVQVLQVT